MHSRRPESAKAASCRHGAAAYAVLVVALALFVIQLLRTTWVADDAFITLRTVDNLVHGWGLRWNVAERVQTFTHPLWLALEIVPYAIVRDPFYAVMLLSIATSLVTVGLLAFRSGVPPLRATAAVAVLTLSNAFLDYSTSGLENPLTHLLLLGLVIVATDDRPWEDKSLMLGCVAGLLGLNRLDLLAIAAPVIALTAVRGWSRKTMRHLLIGLLPLVVWEVFAVFYYGSLLPNSVIAKFQTGVPGSELMEQGLAYLTNSLHWDPVTLVIIAIAIVAVVIDHRPAPLALGVGLILYIALVVKVGGDFMSGRFLSGPFFASVVLLSRRPWLNRASAAAVVVAGAVALSAVAPRPAYGAGGLRDLALSNLVDATGIADERRYYFNSAGLFNGAPGWERPTAAAKRRARDILCEGSGIAVEGSVGVTGFFAGPGVHIIDYYGLGDPVLSRLPMVSSDPSTSTFMTAFGRAPRAWRIGHFRRNIPRGYLATVVTGRNQTREPGVAGLVDLVRLVTQGPLWDTGRWAAIIQLASSTVPFKVGMRPAYQRTDWTEVLRVEPSSVEAVYQIATELHNANLMDEAANAYAVVLTRCPTHSVALDGLGKWALHRGDYGLAEELGTRAVKAAPTAWQGYVVMSYAMRGQRRFDDAARILESLAARDPTFGAQALDLLGDLWLQAADPVRARAAYTRALERDPGLVTAREQLQRLAALDDEKNWE